MVIFGKSVTVISRFVENLRHSLICPEISLLSMNTYPFRGGFGVATAVELTENIPEPDISKIRLMVQKSGGFPHQLRLVVSPTIYRVSKTSQVVSWDF